MRSEFGVGHDIGVILELEKEDGGVGGDKAHLKVK